MRIGWFMLWIVLLAGCQQEQKMQENPLAYAVITGHIKNREVYPQQRSLKVIVPSFDNSQTIQECEIKEDDRFSFRFQPLALRDISIETFVPYILIRPGDSLHIELDFGNLNKAEFSGTAGKLNQDLYAFTDGEGCYLEQRSGTADQMLSPGEFRAKMSGQLEERVKRYGAFSEKHKADPELEKWVKKGLEAEYYAHLMNYGMLHLVMTGDTVPDAFYDFDSSLEDLFTEEVIHSKLFELSSQYQSRVRQQIDPELSLPEKVEQAAATTKNKVLSQFMVASFLDADLNCNQVTYFEDNRDYFDEHITLPLLRESLLQKYKDKRAYLTNPKPMSDAMLYGVDYENGIAPVVETGMKKLQDVVRKNAGKVVLINFWSGCPAALAELKPLSEMVNDYQGKEIEFVSITSEGELLQKWGGHYDLGDQSYFWKSEDIRQIMRNWHVNWSPYYLLINQEGLIVDYGSHIRPGFAETKEKIDRLLNK